MVLSDRTIIPSRQQVMVVARLSINVVTEHWYHVFVSLRIQMMHLVAFVEHIAHKRWWRSVHDRRRNHVRHIPMVLVLGYAVLFSRVELSHCTQMHISTENGHSNRLFRGKLLQLLNEPVALLLVMFRGPVIIEVVQYFDSAIELIDKATKDTSPPYRFDRIHDLGRQDVL